MKELVSGDTADAGFFIPPSLVWPAYIAANVAVLIAVGAGIAMWSPSNPRVLYLVLLTALCSIPILKLQRLNGEHFLLAVYLAVFYNYFAVFDLMSILVGRTYGADTAMLSASEILITASCACVLLGYYAVARSGKRTHAVPSDWPLRNLLIVGIAFWIAGTISLGYWQVFIIADRSNATLLKNLNNLGTGMATIFMLGQLVQPLGVLILAYAYAKFRRPPLLALALLVVITQIVLGFVADFKGEAMQAGILVIIAKTYVDGKLPKMWLLAGALFVLLAFPVFQAYRLQVRGEHGVSSLQTLQNLVSTLESALQANEKASKGFGGSAYQTQSFWERASLKQSVELIVQRTGEDKPYQKGATLTPILAAFIPKILWPDKPSLSVGQVFNKEFQLAEADTYISPSHIGELYWNFGWLGVILGSASIGILLGVVGPRCAAIPYASLTRMLILVVTIYAFGIGSEGSIAVAYVPWMRGMAAIAILHWLFARRPAVRPADAAVGDAAPTGGPAAGQAVFPQLLR
jgi:hypothetical protein